MSILICQIFISERAIKISVIQSTTGQAFGRVIAWYSRLAVNPARFCLQDYHRPVASAVIWACWHGSNLILLESYHCLNPERTLFVLATPGLIGDINNGRFVGMRVSAFALPQVGVGNPAVALKAMVRGLETGNDVGIAPDGPAGPARCVRRGILWLALYTGLPIVPVGCAAHPSLRLPRWDRHLVPLPGARIALAVGNPLFVERKADLNMFQELLADQLNAAECRAWEVLDE